MPFTARSVLILVPTLLGNLAVQCWFPLSLYDMLPYSDLKILGFEVNITLEPLNMFLFDSDKVYYDIFSRSQFQ